MIIAKNKLQRKYARKPLTYGNAYREIRNRVTQAIRVARGNYYREKLQLFQNDANKTWNIINSILNRDTGKNSIP